MKIKYLTVLTLAAALFMSACGKSDADLQKAVTDKLAADNVTGVTAVVKDGVATLTGEVADITVKNKAEASAKVEGIKSVVNSLTLKALPPPPPAPADPMLKGKLDENLKKAGCTGVTIAVTAGTVTATGTVPDAKYVECIQIINQSGLGKLDNKLVRGK
ncbi:MAG: BON domain-containing protein [Saprospiraceae bacterium]|nr:BON domain-containing protein [Pyrinomonadaceae bacterium]